VECLATSTNELFAQRAADLRDINNRILAILIGSTKQILKPDFSDVILITENLTPSEAIQMDRKTFAAFATTSGGATSHVAILARSLGIPAIAGLDMAALRIVSGTEVILDGERGEIRLNPSADEKAMAQEQR